MVRSDIISEDLQFWDRFRQGPVGQEEVPVDLASVGPVASRIDRESARSDVPTSATARGMVHSMAHGVRGTVPDLDVCVLLTSRLAMYRVQHVDRCTRGLEVVSEVRFRDSTTDRQGRVRESGISVEVPRLRTEGGGVVGHAVDGAKMEGASGPDRPFEQTSEPTCLACESNHDLEFASRGDVEPEPARSHVTVGMEVSIGGGSSRR